MSLLRSASSLKRANAALIVGLGLQLDAEFLQALLEGVAARELAQHDLVGGPAHVLGAHDLVGVARLEHAVLVDAGGVREGVGADHRLVRLHDEAGGLRHQARRRHDLGRVDAERRGRSSRARVFTAITTSSSEQLPARSPRPLIVHSTWRAPPIFTPASEFATAMPRSLWQCTDQTALSEFGMRLAQVADELAVQLGHGVADGVGDVDGRRAFGDHGLEHPAQEIRIGAVAVLGRELDVAGEVAGEAHRQLAPARTPARASCAASSPCAARWWR